MMKKSSLGRRSSAAPRKTEATDRNKTSIPVFARSKSSNSLIPTHSGVKKRDNSADRVSMTRKRDPSTDRISEYLMYNTPCSSTTRTPRTMTMSSGRPSSMGGRKGDDRPLAEKEWQAGAIQLICEILNRDLAGSNVLSNAKSLKPMSLALFVDICNYFVKRLDPQLELNRMNYTTELPYILKKLMYRGKADKGLLQTVNTMHNWPNVLGILHFLAELVQSMDAFASQGLDPLYPNVIGQEQVDDLNFKYVVPFLHDLWRYPIQGNIDIDQLVEERMHDVRQIIANSGFSLNIEKEERKIQEEVFHLTEIRDSHLSEVEKVETEYGALNERRNTVKERLESNRRELDELKASIQQEEISIAQLQNDIVYIDKECSHTQQILDQYQSSDDKQLTRDEFESYVNKKKEIKNNIIFEKDMIFALDQDWFDDACKCADIKVKCEKLFKQYNAKISDILEHDTSVKGAICYTRPKIGSTPCNDATAALLEKTLTSYKQRISQLESNIKEIDETDSDFHTSEEIKEIKAMLQHFKEIHSLDQDKFEKKKEELQEELDKTERENKEIDNEIVYLQEMIKKNQKEYDDTEKQFAMKEDKLRKIHTMNQEKLEARFKSIVILDEKLRNMIKEEAGWVQELRNNLELVLRNNKIPKSIRDEIRSKAAHFITDNREDEI